MDCGIPFCHQGCPLGNLIPDWNDLVYRDRWREAIDRLHATNNFPEFTGHAVPGAVRGLVRARHQRRSRSRSRRSSSRSSIARSTRAGSRREPPEVRTGQDGGGRRLGAGRASPPPQQLNRAGHRVTVFERADRIGGLLRYGIPEFKMEKRVLDRRLDLMESRGRRVSRPARHVGVDVPVERSAQRVRRARALPAAPRAPRDLPVPGRELAGRPLRDGVPDAAEPALRGRRRRRRRAVHHRRRTSTSSSSAAATPGADCLGTAHRQGARSVHQLELLPRPPDERAADNPWPLWPNIFRVSSAHEEGGERVYAVSTERFLGDERGRRARRSQAVKVEMVARGRARSRSRRCRAREFELPADLVLLAMGFVGPERPGMLDAARRAADRPRQRLARRELDDERAGRVHRRRHAARPVADRLGDRRGPQRRPGVDRYLMGRSDLPAPLS